MPDRDLTPLGEQILRVLVNTTQDYAMIALDPRGRVIYWNEGAVQTLGYSTDEALNRPFEFLFTDEDQHNEVPAQELRVALKQGRSEDERWHVRKDGSRFWAMGLVVPVRDPATTERLLGFGKILRDRTDIKQLQEALRNRATELAQADEQKRIFISMLAHELRNPLAVFMSGVALLKKKDASKLDRVTEMMERQVFHTQRLVEDLLDIARVGQKKLGLKRSPVDVREIVKQAEAMSRVSMESLGHDFRCDLPASPLMVYGDSDRLVQVFVNLLNNAAKFTEPRGTVTLAAVSEGNEAVIRIVDTGLGIAPEHLASIFELFSQAHIGRPESKLGLGIGLALTRDLVTLHDGTIQARSQGIGTGSEFIVRLPLLSGVQDITRNSNSE